MTYCEGCRRRLPKYLGIHMGELEQIRCTARRFRPEVGRIVRQSVTIRPGRLEVDPSKPIPFTAGG